MSMVVEIFKEFTFEAAHYLPHVPVGHKCRRLHGHSFRAIVHVSGPIHSHCGWVVDFADVKAAFQPLFEQLDHRLLNEIEGLENPTSENIAAWIWERLEHRLSGLSRVAVSETCTTGAVIVRGRT
jgi:6-pyruvoyltetrahydropterin/6-carboxytetrahydropterin synthase